VATLEQCWKELKAAAPQEKFHVNLCGVSFYRRCGENAFEGDAPAGRGQLVAEGCLNQGHR